MRLIGMLDSPYVRRVAITLQQLGLAFRHESVSVFRGWDAFRAINPVVKAPSLVCDDGTVLMESSLICDYAEALARPRSLLPAAPAERAQALRLCGLALIACEKSVQLVYERSLRPEEKRHAPWTDRVTGQLATACAELEQALGALDDAMFDPATTQAGVCIGTMWRFVSTATPAALPARHPRLEAFSARAEALPAWRAAPHGEGTYPAAG